jgi:hypothetical protein
MNKSHKLAMVAVSALAAATLTTLRASAADPSIDQAIAELESTVATLETRVERLKDVDAIENLVSAYGYYLDKQQWDDFVDLFSESSTMEISQRGVYVGKASIRKAMELFGPQNIEPDHVHNHMQFQPVITVAPDGKTAKVRSRAFSTLGTYGRFGTWMGGIYENELVKEDGVWRFKLDHVYTTYFADYEKGWTHGPRPTAKPSPKIPPDRPSTEDYEAFPEVHIPAFHYPHPVTGQPVQLPRKTEASE